jgi:hypothetical protein
MGGRPDWEHKKEGVKIAHSIYKVHSMDLIANYYYN